MLAGSIPAVWEGQQRDDLPFVLPAGGISPADLSGVCRPGPDRVCFSLSAAPISGGSTLSQQQLAAEQVRQQEKQRIAGVVPNFNVSYNENAVPLSPRQKLHIAFRTAVDPVSFAVAGVDAARSQAQNDFPGYGQGLQGYGKRWGAAYADNFDGTLLGNAIFPILFRAGSTILPARDGKLFLTPFLLSFHHRMVQKGQRQVGAELLQTS